MNKIGIISGSGELPLAVGKNLILKKYQICFFLIKNFADPLIYNNYNKVEIELNSFNKILQNLKNEKIDKIIMVGKIIRPSIKDIKFELSTIKLIKEFFLESKGDDQLLKLISNFFKKKGFPLFDWKKNCEELFTMKNHLTKKKPSKIAINNKNKGIDIFKIIGKADVGQSLIIQNQLILGIECLEGTDELISRCQKYKKHGDKGVLLKLTKHKQHSELDLPTIGINTVKKLYDNNYEGLFIEKNQCIILNKDLVIDFCNEKKLFLSTVEKIDK